MAARVHPSTGVVSTYPPERCGLATFTKSLVHSIADGRRSWDSIGVVRVASAPGPAPDEVSVSFNPASLSGRGGWAPGERRPGFDQQPLEAWAKADAAVAAFEASHDPSWLAIVEWAASWFLGRNDVGCCLYDADNGGGYDGLTPDGPNLKQGAESTLSALATLLRAQQFSGWFSPRSERSVLR